MEKSDKMWFVMRFKLNTKSSSCRKNVSNYSLEKTKLKRFCEKKKISEGFLTD